MVENLSESVLLAQKATATTSAKELWEKLKAVYGAISNDRKAMLFYDFTMFKMKGNEKMQSYIDRFEVLSNRLANAGVVISDDQLLFRLMSGAPQSMTENIRYVATDVNKLKVLQLFLEARQPPNF